VRERLRALAVLVALLTGTTMAARQAAVLRVVDAREGREATFAELSLRTADVLILGVPGASPAAHRALPAVVDALARGRDDVALALEGLDRQAQEPFDHYQMGHTSEAEFLAGVARPLASYARDYKPIVDAAIKQGWTIAAAAMPRPIADAVAERGRPALAGLSADERAFVAAADQCDGYAGPGRLPVRPFSGLSWCLENETVAESITQLHAAASLGGKRPAVIAIVPHDFVGHLTRLTGDVLRRMPGRTVVPVLVRAVARPQTVVLEASDLADPRFLVYVAE
jgi:hypothetical protein